MDTATLAGHLAQDFFANQKTACLYQCSKIIKNILTKAIFVWLIGGSFL
jgi:hypothetical protein